MATIVSAKYSNTAYNSQWHWGTVNPERFAPNMYWSINTHYIIFCINFSSEVHSLSFKVRFGDEPKNLEVYLLPREVSGPSMSHYAIGTIIVPGYETGNAVDVSFGSFSTDEPSTVYVGFYTESNSADLNFYDIAASEESLPSAIPIFPATDCYVDRKAVTNFQFDAVNQYGTVKEIELEYSLNDGQAWIPIGVVFRKPYNYPVNSNTFPAQRSILWHVRAMNGDDAWGDWSETAFTTVDYPSVSTPISPKGTVEDTDEDIVFQWSSSNQSGTLPIRADIQFSYNGNDWISLEPTDGTPYKTVPAGTIHTGTIQWRVRSYNRDGDAGDWSPPAVFVARASPRIMEITADGKPFTVFTWQATEQQTYEIEIDNSVIYGSFFGDEKTFQLPDYLDDGVHTVKIRVQNEMNTWSKPGELTFTVLNVPGDDVQLSGDFDLDAELFWDDESDRTDYLVYRDGILIAETSHKSFSDRVVLGEHSYYVVNRYANGYYSKSNIVEHTMSTDVCQIAPLCGGEWLPLEKSENAQQSQSFKHSRNVAYHHFSGDKNPTPEVGDEEVLVGEFDAAWFYTEEGNKMLKHLLGQALIIKSRGEEVVIGVLEAYTKVNRKHFRGYAFSIRQMEWKDYICVE